MITIETKQQLKERLKQINKSLNSLLLLGSNDETLVDEKRMIQKQLKVK